MKNLFIIVLSLTLLPGCSNNKITDTTATTFKEIDNSKIAFSSQIEADFMYNPYNIEDLLGKFYKPEDVDVIEATFNQQGESILTEDGAVFTPYEVKVENVYNPNSSFKQGESITMYNTGGCVSIKDYEPFIQKVDWLNQLKNKSDSWLGSNYYCEPPFTQEQSIDAGDDFLVMSVKTDVGNEIVLGNGLMEIEGDTLINNDDTTDENLPLDDTIRKIEDIYEMK